MRDRFALSVFVSESGTLDGRKIELIFNCIECPNFRSLRPRMTFDKVSMEGQIIDIQRIPPHV